MLAPAGILREPFYKIFQIFGPCGHLKGALLQNSQNSRRVGRVVSCRVASVVVSSFFFTFFYIFQFLLFLTVGPILLAICFFCWVAPVFWPTCLIVVFWPQPTLILATLKAYFAEDTTSRAPSGRSDWTTDQVSVKVGPLPKCP